jgi:hypothetical protein
MAVFFLLSAIGLTAVRLTGSVPTGASTVAIRTMDGSLYFYHVQRPWTALPSMAWGKPEICFVGLGFGPVRESSHSDYRVAVPLWIPMAIPGVWIASRELRRRGAIGRLGTALLFWGAMLVILGTAWIRPRLRPSIVVERTNAILGRYKVDLSEPSSVEYLPEERQWQVTYGRTRWMIFNIDDANDDLRAKTKPSESKP